MRRTKSVRSRVLLSATRRQRNETACKENNVEGGSVGCPQIISVKQYVKLSTMSWGLGSKFLLRKGLHVSDSKNKEKKHEYTVERR